MMNKKISILASEHPLEQQAMRALFALLVLLLCGYLYFVGASVLNIMARKEASAKTTNLQSAIAGMEQQYFALSQSVDASSAHALGLAPVTGTQYVYRPGNAASAGVVARGAI
ncbi:MAG: hypothetical protein WC050_04720 [Candidatus Paceibacterota bacterium]